MAELFVRRGDSLVPVAVVTDAEAAHAVQRLHGEVFLVAELPKPARALWPLQAAAISAALFLMPAFIADWVRPLPEGGSR